MKIRNNDGVNLAEIGKIVREMQSNVKTNPAYNAQAAEIVRQGVEDKNNRHYTPLTNNTLKNMPMKIVCPKPGIL